MDYSINASEKASQVLQARIHSKVNDATIAFAHCRHAACVRRQYADKERWT
jgi:hypothetical protein